MWVAPSSCYGSLEGTVPSSCASHSVEMGQRCRKAGSKTGTGRTYTNLDELLTSFANINKLHPQRDIVETTFDFAYKLPPTHRSLCDELIQQMPQNFQELWVRVRAWKGRQPRTLARS